MPSPAFVDWYKSEWPRLVGALTVVVGDRDVAQDVAAQAMIKAYERWDSGVIASPSPWVHRVAVNLARRRARRLILEARHDSSSRRVVEATPGLEPELWAAVGALPRAQRTAVALRYVGDLTQAQVADAMGVTPGSAAATLSAARRSLRDVLGRDPMEDLS